MATLHGWVKNVRRARPFKARLGVTSMSKGGEIHFVLYRGGDETLKPLEELHVELNAKESGELRATIIALDAATAPLRKDKSG